MYWQEHRHRDEGQHIQNSWTDGQTDNQPKHTNTETQQDKQNQTQNYYNPQNAFMGIARHDACK